MMDSPYAFGYDDRDQMMTYAAIGTNVFTHAYDGIGNLVLGGANAETNTFVANSLNQRVSVLGASAPPRELAYTADGGLANDGRFAYAYDAEDLSGLMIGYWIVCSAQENLA